jgi:hypothetical protein
LAASYVRQISEEEEEEEEEERKSCQLTAERAPKKNTFYEKVASKSVKMIFQWSATE